MAFIKMVLFGVVLRHTQFKHPMCCMQKSAMTL